jgi:hypothetical protein
MTLEVYAGPESEASSFAPELLVPPPLSSSSVVSHSFALRFMRRRTTVSHTAIEEITAQTKRQKHRSTVSNIASHANSRRGRERVTIRAARRAERKMLSFREASCSAGVIGGSANASGP